MNAALSLERDSDLLLHIPGDCFRAFIEVYGGEYQGPFAISGRVTILDIGANVGAFILWARWQWPHSIIYGYEPHPDLFPHLQHNTSHMERVTLFNCAVGDITRTILYEDKISRTCGSLFPSPARTFNQVPVAVIDPSALPEAEMVKIDTEGSEMDVLRGLRFTPKILMIEWHCEKDRKDIDDWAGFRGLELVKQKVHARAIGVAMYVSDSAYVS